jgi:phage shock protein PspC (stress-responsive transcriptional regulator)
MMIDILVALAFAGCIYGIARALGWHPGFRRIAWWTVAVMFGIAAYGELSIAYSSEAKPSVGHVIPLVLLGVSLYLAGRGMEWFARRMEAEDPTAGVPESLAEISELQVAG